MTLGLGEKRYWSTIRSVVDLVAMWGMEKTLKEA